MSLFSAGFSIVRPLLMGLDAEQAHRATIKTLSCLPAQNPVAADPCLKQNLFGLEFPNPLGLAPGGENLKRLIARYPGYNALIADFIARDPLAACRARVLAATDDAQPESVRSPA